MVYFDNAATTFPKPQAVLNAITDAVRIYGGNPGRSGHKVSMRVAEKIFEVRQKAADFFEASPENVIFTANCTMALNMAIKGVMAKGGHIIASCLDHNSVLRPIEAMAQEGRISYSVAAVYEESPERTLESFHALIRPDTRAVVCTHASNVTGTVLPIQRIAALCKAKGLTFILDAAQTAGVLPLSMEKTGADILCMPGHKSLYGPTGTGMLILKDGAVLETLMEGGTGSSSLELLQPDFNPDRFESGTVNTVGILGLGAGLDFVRRKSLKDIYQHEMEICAKVHRELSEIPEVNLLTGSVRQGEKSPVLAFNIGNADSAHIVEELSGKGFMLRGGFHCAGLAHPFLKTDRQGAIRFSPGVFNSTTQAQAFLIEVKKLRRFG